jgi:predicted PurR-regulated permease PerM
LNRASNSPSASSKSSTFIAVALAIAMLYFGRQIFIPLALALVLAFLLAPLVEILEKLRIGRISSVFVVLTLCFALTAAMGWVITNQLVDIMAHVGDYKSNLQEKVRSMRSERAGALGKATANIRELNKELSITEENPPGHSPGDGERSARAQRPVPVQVTPPPSNLIQDLTALLGPLAEPVETGGIVIIFTAFTLIKREDLRNRLIRLGGQGRLHVMTQALDEASRRLSRYLWMQFVVNAVFGTLFGIGLYIIGVPHALLWGALAALLRFIPYVGTLMAAAFPVVLAVAIFPGWKHAAVAFALFAVLELVTGNVVEPFLYGAHTGISSLAILVAAVFWTMLWGPVGLILSTPLTLCLMLAGRYVPQLDFLEVVLGDEPVLRPEEHFYQRLLAMDTDDVRNIAERFLQKEPLENFYQLVVVPALTLAEQDRHMEAIDDRISENLSQNTRELIEDLGERSEKQRAGSAGNEPAHDDRGGESYSPTVVCVPVRDEADELVAMMLAQLLQLGGNRATHIPLGSIHDMFEQIAQNKPAVACVSALPPFAVGQARVMCKRLSAAFPGIKVVVGLWNFAGGIDKAQERIGVGCSNTVASSLTEAILQIRRLSQSQLVSQINSEAHISSAPEAHLAAAHRETTHR